MTVAWAASCRILMLHMTIISHTCIYDIAQCNHISLNDGAIVYIRLHNIRHRISPEFIWFTRLSLLRVGFTWSRLKRTSQNLYDTVSFSD